MSKPIVTDHRYDFRGGRNTAISPDLLNPDELVDTTNVRLVESYGAFTKRSGCQRIHAAAFPASVQGVTQWDTPSGKQVVVISNGDLYYRTGYDYAVAFTKATSSAAARTTANQGATAGWTDPDGADDGTNSASAVVVSPGVANTTVAAGNRLILKFGDPAIDSNLPAIDALYTLSFRVLANGNSLSGTHVSMRSRVSLEYSLNDGGAWTALAGVYDAFAGPGTTQTQTYTPTLSIAGVGTKLWIRLTLDVSVTSTGAGDSGTANGSLFCFATTYQSPNFPGTWNTGAAKFSLTQPAIFAPFRASVAGAPLVLYIASGGHYFSWTSDGTLTQLDPTNSAPLTTSIIAYHTRMFAMSASTVTPGLLPKTLFWSKIGDATIFTTGDKTMGGSAVTDFLTGQQLTALEVIGSSLLMATADSVMRFQGHASDDIVIAQDTEGVSAEVGVVGLLALKRFENAAAFLSDRGPYVATETHAAPIGEAVLPDFNALDSSQLFASVLQYNKGRKELLFAVPRASDSGLNKTIFVQSTRLQSWYGPWTYTFGINCMCHYTVADGIENVLSGGSDGFVRLMDVGALDDVLSNGTGGSNITMTAEIPVIQFGLPGITKSITGMSLQATLPATSDLRIQHSFDTDAAIEESVASAGSIELNYRVDMNNQGKRLKLKFIDASSVAPIINGFSLNGYNYNRA